MRSQNIKSLDHQFSNSEYDAIACVLPLLVYVPNVTLQKKKAASDSIAKINRRAVTFSNHELNAIIESVELSVQLLSGKRPDLLQRISRDTEWLAEMRAQFFVLNGLLQEFQEILQEFG